MATELVLIHGALGSKEQLDFLVEWSKTMNLKPTVVEFSGHGTTKRSHSFSVTQFASELENVLEILPESPLVFGYSMGGYVALDLAARKPQLFAGLITLATKFNWSPEIASKEVKMLSPSVIQDKVHAFAEVLDNRHKKIGWETVCRDTASMMIDLGNEPLITEEVLQSISIPTVFSVGDEDKMVTIDETAWAQKNCPKSNLAVLPLTKHPIERLSQNTFTYLVKNLQEKVGLR